MANWDEMIDNVDATYHYNVAHSTARAALRSAIAELTRERDKYKAFGDEFIWAEDNPNEYQSKMSELEAELKEANGFVDDLGEFLLCVNEPHDTSCAHYRNENKPCDCEYDKLVKRLAEHRARLAKGRE